MGVDGWALKKQRKGIYKCIQVKATVKWKSKSCIVTLSLRSSLSHQPLNLWMVLKIQYPGMQNHCNIHDRLSQLPSISVTLHSTLYTNQTLKGWMNCQDYSCKMFLPEFEHKCGPTNRTVGYADHWTLLDIYFMCMPTSVTVNVFSECNILKISYYGSQIIYWFSSIHIYSAIFQLSCSNGKEEF